MRKYFNFKKKIEKNNIKYEIIIINDGSEDDTQKRLNKLKSKFRLIKIIKNKKNFGKSYSLGGLKFGGTNM